MGSRDGAVVRALVSHKFGPGSSPGLGVTWLRLWLVLVPVPRGFSPGTSVFLSPQKPTFPNSNRSFYSCVLSALAWIESEVGVDLVLIETSLLFLCKCKLISIRTA